MDDWVDRWVFGPGKMELRGLEAFWNREAALIAQAFNGSPAELDGGEVVRRRQAEMEELLGD